VHRVSGRRTLVAMLRTFSAFPAMLACLAIGCGGAARPVEPKAAPSEVTAPAAPAAGSESPGAPAPEAPAEPPPGAATDTASASAPGSDDASKPGAASEAPSPPPKGYTISYRTTPSGLVIELDGLRLEPKVEPIKTAKGWTVKLTVHVHATDDHMHRFLSPEGGPLMVAAEIDRGGGKKDHVVDQRKGDTEAFVTAGDSPPFTRELATAITAGQSLTLHVGLWGLARDADDRKPIKKLFVVKMVAGKRTPQPTILPPS
jgi:hypothetical protein